VKFGVAGGGLEIPGQNGADVQDVLGVAELARFVEIHRRAVAQWQRRGGQIVDVEGRAAQVLPDAVALDEETHVFE